MNNNNNLIKVSVLDSRFDKYAHIECYTWDELAKRLSLSIETEETHREFMEWKKIRSDQTMPDATRKEAARKESAAKDKGGFVGGVLKDGIRNGDNVEIRTLLTLDADNADEKLIDILKSYDKEAFIYSTHSHGGESIKLRIVFPMQRDLTAEEYMAVSRKVAEDLGFSYFDKVSFTPAQLMYFPSHSRDVTPIALEVKGDIIDPDEILGRYENWHDKMQWPGIKEIGEAALQEAGKEQIDPLTKQGVIGDFCRVYSIPDAIETFLSNVYVKGDGENRYTYIAGSGVNGLILYKSNSSSDYVFAYSMHSTDPAGDGHCKNAFDLVRVHKFGYMDSQKDKESRPPEELKSYKSMCRLIAQDEDIKKYRIQKKMEKGKESRGLVETNKEDENNEWMSHLEMDMNGNVVAKGANLLAILRNDPRLTNIRLNMFAGRYMVTGALPWNREGQTDDWTDYDERQLYNYLIDMYGVEFKAYTFNNCFGGVMAERKFDPLKEMIKNLPEWDGEERIDTLFIDYLNAEDNAYTRAVARKTLVAMIAKAMEPERFNSKFDEMLVLYGTPGIGKSTFLERIAGAKWYSDSMSLQDTNGKEAAEKIKEVWLMEIGEMAGAAKADVNRLKNFISRMTDDFREAYGRYSIRHPRRCILTATTNEFNGFLVDITGNRKYWPVQCKSGAKKKPWNISEKDREQFLAEAYCYWASGETPILEGEAAELAEHEQRKALIHDERAGIVQEFLNTPLPDKWEELTIQDRAKFWQDPEKARTLEPEKYAGENQRQTVCAMELHIELFGGTKANCDRKASMTYARIMAELSDEWIKDEEGGKRIDTKNYGRQRAWSRK